MRKFALVSICTILFFSSCRIEKRLYRDGYYFSGKKHSKSCPKENHEQSTSAIIIPGEQQEPTVTASSDTSIHPVEIQLPVISQQPTQLKKENRVHDSAVVSTAESHSKMEDKEETPKDVKHLLWGSIGVLGISLLYGLLMSLGSVAANVVFALLPFSIIGLWIFALLLRNKYGQEDSYSPTEKKDKKEREYSQRRAFLLSGFLGIFGAHRFYLGYPKIGLLQMFTLGGFLVWFFIDMIRIKIGKLKPFEGDYTKGGESTYERGKKKKVMNKSMKTIRIALLISLVALLAFLSFALFL